MGEWGEKRDLLSCINLKDQIKGFLAVSITLSPSPSSLTKGKELSLIEQGRIFLIILIKPWVNLWRHRAVFRLLYVSNLKHSKYRQIKVQAQLKKHQFLKVRAQRASVQISTQQKTGNSATSRFCLFSSIFNLGAFRHPLQLQNHSVRSNCS